MGVTSPPRSVTRLGILLSDPIRTPDGGGLLDSGSALARSAEEVGFDSLWLRDRGRESSPYEAFSLLGALAVRTRSIRLGAFPMPWDIREPSIVAKNVTGIDVISHGRGTLAVTLDAGEGDDAADQLAERLQVSRAMLEDERPEFSGRFYRIDGAVNRPQAVQAGGIPLVVLIEMGNPISTRLRTEGLRIAAEHADAAVVTGSPDQVGAAADVVRAGSIEVIWMGSVLVGDDHRVANVDALSGTPAQVADQLRDRLVAGANGCIVSLEGSDQLGAIADYGPALQDAVRSVVTVTGEPGGL